MTGAIPSKGAEENHDKLCFFWCNLCLDKPRLTYTLGYTKIWKTTGWFLPGPGGLNPQHRGSRHATLNERF